jgi:hypothetical protein
MVNSISNRFRIKYFIIVFYHLQNTPPYFIPVEFPVIDKYNFSIEINIIKIRDDSNSHSVLDFGYFVAKAYSI